MRRRQFIASAGVIGATALAGCVSNNDNDDGNGGENGGSPVPQQRVDKPPHDPERPPEDDWDDAWLGEGMATEPSLPFETVEASLADPRLDGFDGEMEFAATLVGSADDLKSTIDMESAPDRLANVDFGRETVVVVEDGYGSSSVGHGWRRAENVDTGVHLHGYRTDPQIQTRDIAPRHSVLIVGSTLGTDDRAGVSLTIGADERVNFDSDEGVVGVKRRD